MDPINLDDIKRLNVKPGDVLVIHVAEHLGPDQLAGIRDAIEQKFEKTTALVLSGGAKLAAVLDPMELTDEPYHDALAYGLMTKNEARAQADASK